MNQRKLKDQFKLETGFEYSSKSIFHYTKWLELRYHGLLCKQGKLELSLIDYYKESKEIKQKYTKLESSYNKLLEQVKNSKKL